MNKEIFEELWMIVDRLESNITNIFISKEEMEPMISELSSLIEDLDEERVEKILNITARQSLCKLLVWGDNNET